MEDFCFSVCFLVYVYRSRLFLNFDRGIALASIKSSEWAIRRQTMYIFFILSCPWRHGEEYTPQGCILAHMYWMTSCIA